jgi:hypothetical protein
MWFIGQSSLPPDAGKGSSALILGFFSAETLGLIIVIFGAFLMYKGIIGWKTLSNSGSVRAMFADSLATPRDLRVGVLFGIAYGFVYLFFSATLVFQPLVDFAAAYGIRGSELNAVVC